MRWIDNALYWYSWCQGRGELLSCTWGARGERLDAPPPLSARAVAVVGLDE